MKIGGELMQPNNNQNRLSDRQQFAAQAALQALAETFRGKNDE